jgi:hypothetical protein
MSATLFPGDRVMWTGAPANPNWDPCTEGTIARVRATGLVDVRWDDFGTFINERLSPENLTRVTH